MGKRKFVFAALGVVGVYIVASGGIFPLITAQELALERLVAPLESSTAFDIALGMVSLILVAWALLLDGTEKTTTYTRAQLLRGVALGSAVMAAVFTIVNIATAPSYLFPEFPAVLAIVGILHAFVGMTAAMLLLARRESRGVSRLPLFTNALTMAAALSLVVVPLYTQ